MPMTPTPNVQLPRLDEGQQRAETKINTAFNLIDSILQPLVISHSTTPPGGTPAEGTKYLVKGTATGAWTGQEDKIAAYFGGWIFFTPMEGWSVYVQNLNSWMWYTGADWTRTTKFPTFATASRPAASQAGRAYYDVTLGKPAWDDGAGNYRDAAGTIV